MPRGINTYDEARLQQRNYAIEDRLQIIHPPLLVDDASLVLHLDAGNVQSYPGSGTVWTNLSNFGYMGNATLVNGPTFNSANGGSIVFDGTNDYATTSIPAQINTYTLSVWVYFNSLTLTETSLYATSATNLSVLNSAATGNQYKWHSWTGSTSRISSQVVTTNTWYNIVMTSETRFYVNGINTDSFGNVATLRVGSQDIGGSGGSSRSVNGRIPMVSLYTRVLGAGEIQQNYDAICTRFNL